MSPSTSALPGALQQAGDLAQDPTPATSIPPGPPWSPIAMLRFIANPRRYFVRMAARYGDPFTLQGPVGTVVVTGRPEGVRALFALDPARIAVPRTEVLAPLVGSYALILESGARHLHDRKLLMPPFHGERMRAYGQAMADIAVRHAATIAPGRPFAMVDITQAIALDVIIRTVFGTTDPARAKTLHRAVVDLVAAMRPSIVLMPWTRRQLLGLGPWARYQKVQARMRQLTLDEIAARRREEQGEDILSLLLAARYDDGQLPPDEWVRDQLGTLLFAGHETTAVALAWALDHIHRDPAVLERLRQEFAGLGANPTPEAIAALPYLSAVCWETLRVHPGLVNLPARLLREPTSFLGYRLPAGVSVSATPLLLHQDPALYPQPERFQPERFLGKTPPPTELISFGGGARRCIGAAFALYEMKVVLYTLLSRCRFQVIDGRQDREVIRSITVGPSRGVRMVRV